MIVDGRGVPNASHIDTDICIVGAGPAGLALALEFISSPNTRVVILETGAIDFDPTEQDLATAEVVGQDYFPVHETRIRMFGGSTISWGGIVAPLDPIDFAQRSWVPYSGWPIDRADLDPYYSRAFALCEVDPEGADSSTAALDARDEMHPTPDTVWDSIWFSAPARFGKMYEGAIRSSSNITTYLHSTAVKLHAAEGGDHVASLEVGTRGSHRFHVRARRYVLAGGGIENARLLMTSNDVVPEGIGNQNDLVGRFFQEHPRVFNRYVLDGDGEALAHFVTGAAGTLRFSRLGLSEEVQEREGLLNFITNLSFGYAGQETPQFEAIRRVVNASRKPWSDSPYYQDTGGGPNKVRWEDVKTSMVKPHRTVQSLIGAALRPAGMRRWLSIGCSVEQPPRPENRIVLSNDRDRFGIPKAELHWTLSEEEERTYRRGMEIVLNAIETYAPGISERRFDDVDPWPSKALGTWHHAGTTRMSSSPSDGVVDEDLRVHGVDNLFITGSSVFTTSGATAPTLTTLALSIRLAEHLKKIESIG
jgi:choline dehydrogenase-like flavoprotein